MITELTAEQEARMPFYVKKWTEIGLSTHTDREKAERVIDDVYKVGGLEAPREKKWFRSPMEIVEFLAFERKVSLKQAWSDCEFIYGLHDASWLSFYDFFRLECGLECCNDLVPLMELASCCGWSVPYREVVLMSDKPIECHVILDERGDHTILHRDLGPALLYGDGFALYALNGVIISNKDIVLKSADELDPSLIKTEQNADVRREIIRKIGIKKVIEKLGAKTIDEVGFYKLILLTINDQERPYLQMKDATTNEWYIEGVKPDIRTVKAALAWREGDDEDDYVEPIVRT